MKKIISLYKRDYDGNRLVYNEVVPGLPVFGSSSVVGSNELVGPKVQGE